MLNLSQVETFYPEPIRAFKKNILREYLQYKILEIIYESKYAERLVFMGGTSIRIIYGNNRFSEDLDFDNFRLIEKEFNELCALIQKKLILQGFSIEIKIVLKQAFHCNIGVLNILYENGISHHKGEKLNIKLDTEPQGVAFSPDKIILNKFDVFTRINVVPDDLLLAQKIFAILNRKRLMGRDIFDAVFLFGRTQPDFNYLKKKINLSDMQELKERLLSKCEELDFDALSRDVEPFLVKPDEARKILIFRDYIKNINPEP